MSIYIYIHACIFIHTYLYIYMHQFLHIHIHISILLHVFLSNINIMHFSLFFQKKHMQTASNVKVPSKRASFRSGATRKTLALGQPDTPAWDPWKTLGSMAGQLAPPTYQGTIGCTPDSVPMVFRDSWGL